MNAPTAPTPSIMSLLARCPSCVKTYRVPHDRKEWHCKSCQGVLELELEATEPALPEGVACAACGAISFDAQTFCEECGQALDSAPGEAPRRARRQDEKQASAEMRRAFKKISYLKMWLTFNFWGSCLLGVGVLLILFLVEFELGVKIVMVVAQTISIALAYAAVRLVERNPFPVITALAGLQTLSAVWSFYDEGPFVFGAIWAAFLWMLAGLAAQVTRLAKQYPDLYLSRRMRGEHLTAGGKGDPGSSGAGRRSAVRRANEIKQKRKSMLIMGGAVLALVALVLVFDARNKSGATPARASNRTTSLPSPEAAIERFRSAWNAGDIPAMVAEAKPSLASKLERALKSLGKRYDWGTRFPPLGDADWQEATATSLRVYYSTDVGEFPVRFSLLDGRWVLRTITTSEIKDWRPE